MRHAFAPKFEPQRNKKRTKITEIVVSTYADAIFSMISGILTLVDGTVLFDRTQNLINTRRFCVARKIIESVVNR